MVHYNRERNHQGIGNEPIDGEATGGTGSIECTERIDGLLEFYHHAG